MSDVLKPCLFCGGEAELYSWDQGVEDYHIRCIDCGVATADYDTVKEAIAAWNRRAEDASVKQNHH